MDKCDERVFRCGDVVAITDMPKEQADQHCKDMTADSDKQYDWHYSGGRVVIKALRKDYVTDKERIAQLEAQLPQWISVDERLPDENARVLVFIEGGGVQQSDYCRESDGALDFDYLDVTHWMPLPAPPTTEEE